MHTSGDTRGYYLLPAWLLLACSGEGETASSDIGSTSAGVDTNQTATANADASTATSDGLATTTGSATSGGTAPGTTLSTNTSAGQASGAGGSTNASTGTQSSGAGGETTTTAGTQSSAAGGMGGASTSGDSVVCVDDGISQEPASCQTTEESPCCARCIEVNCCTEYENCFATPANVCGGTQTSDSEFLTIMECMLSIEGGSLPSDIDQCVAEGAEVAATQCGLGTISAQSNELVACILDDSNDVGGCFFECFDGSFEGECLYDLD